MARIKFKVKSIAGKDLADVGIVINLKNHGLVEKTTDENGETSISGVEVGSTLVSVSKEGFEGQNFSVEVNSEDQTVVKELVLLNTKKEVKVEEDLIVDILLVIAKAIWQIQLNQVMQVNLLLLKVIRLQEQIFNSHFQQVMTTVLQ